MWMLSLIKKGTSHDQVLAGLNGLVVGNIVEHSQFMPVNALFLASKFDAELVLSRTPEEGPSMLNLFDIWFDPKQLWQAAKLDGNGLFDMNTEHETVVALCSMCDISIPRGVTTVNYDGSTIYQLTSSGTFIAELGTAYSAGFNKGFVEGHARGFSEGMETADGL